MQNLDVKQAVACEEETKMLGAHVPEDVYWRFKTAVSNRKETMGDAILHAALMYIDAEDK